MKPQWKLLLALGFPILLIAGWLTQIEVQRSRATEVELAIRGYDPRDLLSGHYLTYTVDFQAPDLCKGSYADNHCVCIEQVPGQLARAGQTGDCESVSCPLFLKGSCRYGNFASGIDRYYFPETQTKHLAVVPAKASIRVKITADGTGFVQELRVDGQSLADWLRAQSAK